MTLRRPTGSQSSSGGKTAARSGGKTAARHAASEELAAMARAGLAQRPRRLAAKYFYDAVGSALFEAITRLSEYGLTRADARLIKAHAGEIARRLPRRVRVAELGSGSAIKTRPLLEKIARGREIAYCPIDVSAAALARCRFELRDLTAVRFRAIEAGYLAGLERALAGRAAEEAVLLLFLGSSIGNFEAEEALEFLRALRQRLEPGDWFLLGADLVKDAEALRRAYDDAAGVTAAFNKNLLARLNRELGANFDLSLFAHEARYDAKARRVEMHLRSLKRQRVRIPSGPEFTLEAGETIWTESSYKYRPRELKAWARQSGFEPIAEWRDRAWPFSENLWRAKG